MTTKNETRFDADRSITELSGTILELQRERDEAKHALRRSLAHANDLAAQVKRLEPDAKRWAAWRADALLMFTCTDGDTPLILAIEELGVGELSEDCTPAQFDALIDQAIAKCGG